MDLITLGIGGLIGFLSAIGKDFLLENKKQKIKDKTFKRQKLEEIFLLMDKVSQEAIKPLQYKNSLDGIGAKLGMTIRFYFPQLQDEYSKFLNVFQVISGKTTSLNNPIELSSKEITDYWAAHRLFINKVVIESKKYM